MKRKILLIISYVVTLCVICLYFYINKDNINTLRKEETYNVYVDSCIIENMTPYDYKFIGYFDYNGIKITHKLTYDNYKEICDKTNTYVPYKTEVFYVKKFNTNNVILFHYKLILLMFFIVFIFLIILELVTNERK